MKNFFSTKTAYNGELQETVTIADSEGNSVFITEADWIEIGKMKRWCPDNYGETVEEVQIEEEP